jgi:hypothetical protein
VKTGEKEKNKKREKRQRGRKKKRRGQVRAADSDLGLMDYPATCFQGCV